MNFLRCLSACAAALLLWAGAPLPALAQADTQAQSQSQTQRKTRFFTDRVSLQINFGGQAGSGDFTQRLTPEIYNETAAIDVAQSFDSGVLFDVGGSFAIRGSFLAGVSYSRSGGDGGATIAAQIPHPLIFDQPRGASASAGGLDHVENAVHLQAQYRYAVSPKIDVTVGLGPTFFSVSQELVQEVTVAETAGGPSITPVVARPSEGAVGFNIGADVTYMLTPRWGAGLLLRWAGSSADFATPSGPAVEVDVGGFQVAVGARARF